MRFKTLSGSVYEVDHAKSRIRRITGTHAPTNSQGADGEWRPYHSALVELGIPAVVQWSMNVPKYTVTSRVTEIINEKTVVN